MNAYLHAAYAATWIIHIVYLSSIAARYRRLKRDIEELNRRS
ncbi:MAG TPA: CcmD family protein [Terriglobales bacterium]|nr:CcmD family protein [Terriglobales bacterium]